MMQITLGSAFISFDLHVFFCIRYVNKYLSKAAGILNSISVDAGNSGGSIKECPSDFLTEDRLESYVIANIMVEKKWGCI
jgi:hypothetical protein